MAKTNLHLQLTEFTILGYYSDEYEEVIAMWEAYTDEIIRRYLIETLQQS